MPKTRQDFWQAKLESNVKRDRRNQRDLKKAGWKVLVVWECEVMREPFAVLDKVLRAIGTEAHSLTYENLPDKRTILKVAEDRFQWNLRQPREQPLLRRTKGAV